MYVVALVKHMPNAHMLSLVVFLAMAGASSAGRAARSCR